MSRFVQYLRSLQVSRELWLANGSNEGNLLNIPDPEPRIEFLRDALRLSQPRRIVETGTNQGMFGLFLAHTLREVTLYTFDIDRRAGRCADILNRAFQNLHVIFMLGDTKATLPVAFPCSHEIPADFAWIDGGHDETTAYSDLVVMMAAGVPFIAVDDVKSMPGVAPALARALADYPAYFVHPHHPWWDDDAAGAALLERKQCS